MKKLENILVTTGGVLYLLFGVFHLTFFRVFNQHNPDFNQIVPFLSKIMVMLNLGIVILFFSLGAIILRFRQEVINTRVGRALLLVSAFFFTIRGLAEFFFDSYKIAFVLTMLVVSMVYYIPLFSQKKRT